MGFKTLLYPIKNCEILHVVGTFSSMNQVVPFFAKQTNLGNLTETSPIFHMRETGLDKRSSSSISKMDKWHCWSNADKFVIFKYKRK